MALNILVLGIGNTLLSDEAVGVVAMRALEQDWGEREGVEFLDGGTLSFTLAVPIGECDALLVIDAARFGEPPGTVRCFEGEAMDRFLGENRKGSVHEVGLVDLMAIARLGGHWPTRRALIGIEPAKVDWGEALTPAVAAALPAVYAIGGELIARWHKGG